MTYIVKNSWNTAKKQFYNNHQYDSGFESAYARELDFRKKAKEIISWQPHVPIDLIVNGYRVCTYTIDFVVHYPDGITEYVETKGRPTYDWRLKWKLFEALYSKHPDTRLVVVQQHSNWRIPKVKKKSAK